MAVIRKLVSIALAVSLVATLTPAQDVKMGMETKSGTVVRTSMIVGKPFTTPSGERLGEVRDIVLEPGGCIAYAVVAYTGVTDKLYAVPWGAFTSSGDAIALAITPDRVKTAPSFEINRWPDFTDQKFVNEVTAFYNVRDAGPRRTIGIEERRSGVETDAFPVGTFDAGRIRTYTGTVVRYDEAGNTVVLRSGNEPERTIQVAPSTFLRQEKIEFRPNETVTLKAAEVDRNGQKVFVGTEVKAGDRTVMFRDASGNPRWHKVGKDHDMKDKDMRKEKEREKE
jgi:hypothetical protein